MPLVRKPTETGRIPNGINTSNTPKEDAYSDIEKKIQTPTPSILKSPYDVNLSETNIAFKHATGESGAKKLDISMDVEVHANKRFMAKYHRYEPKVRDSTAIRTLKTCARKYFYQIVLGRVSKEDNVIFAWGSAYHLFREVLEIQYGFGPDRPKTYDPKRGEQAVVIAIQKGIDYWKKHGKDQEEGSKYGFMTTGRLFLSFKAAFQHWEAEKKKNEIHVIAVEQPLIVRLEDGSYTGGKCDQIVKWRGQKWGRDWKTTTIDPKYYERGLEPNDQFTRYTLMESLVTGEQIQGQVVEVLYNNNHTKTVKKGPEIHVFTTSRTTQQLEQFEREQAHWNRILELHRESDIWPMQEESCKYCPFRSVCVKPTESGMMAQLEQFFSVRPWDFTKIGEE